MSRLTKIGLTLTALSIAVAALITNSLSSLYPGLYVGVAVGGISIIIVAIKDNQPANLALILGVISLSLFIRLYTFYYPASMIGMDPHRKAISTQRVINTGHTDMIVQYFYRDVPLFNIYPAQFGLIADLNGITSLGIYPILMSILLPLTGVVLTKRWTNQNTDSLIIVAAVIGSMETTGILEGFWVHNQTMGILLWCVLMIILIPRAQEQMRQSIAGLVILIAMLFTHKLPLLVSIIVCLTTYLYSYLYNKISERGDLFVNSSSNTILWFGFISGILFIIQWIYVTKFIDRFIVYGASVLTPSNIGTASDLDPTAATKPLSPLIELALWRGHGFSLLFFAGISWVVFHFLNWQNDHKVNMNQTGILIVVTSAVLAAGAVFGAINPGVIPVNRSISFAGPVFAALICYIFLNKNYELKWAKQIGAVMISLLILTQLFAMPIMIDNPNRPRMYLTSGEVEAKEFNHEFISNYIYTDWYYTKEIIPSQIIKLGQEDGIRRFNTQHRPLQIELLNAELRGTDYRYISIRTSATVQRTTYGKFKLIWNPEKRLDKNINRIYDNDDTVTYIS